MYQDAKSTRARSECSGEGWLERRVGRRNDAERRKIGIPSFQVRVEVGSGEVSGEEALRITREAAVTQDGGGGAANKRIQLCGTWSRAASS